MNRSADMNCPSCQSPMKKGYVQSSSRLAWVPNVSKLSVEPRFTKNAVLLSNQSRFSINYVEAFLCEACQKVVIDYKE